MRNNADLICLECPLNSCDTDSLWCAYRFVTDPNEAQQRFTNKMIRRKASKVSRKEYQAARYIANRETMLRRANERNAQMKEQERRG